ncbi:3-hydroxyacyl-CoA dehydrogenase family protein [Halopenitus sp. H-Gu1]|uniref:3-hydroxyacyl-CoA dehydrogenase family protein n=1 Tax=Halopenitus sp. H-Gu1 TaxID=3242697 RepID=UPI00359D830C
MIRTVTIVGAGDMGSGFAVHFARHDLDVTLVDHRESNLREADERIREAVAGLASRGVTDRSPDAVSEAVSSNTDLRSGVADADLVLETVPEDLAIKHDVFPTIADAAPAEAILASNTSGIPITDIAEAVPDDAERVVGCHWWYPPYLLEPVEVVRGAETSDRTMERTQEFLKSVDRRPIVVERDVPGFVWNRIQNAVVRECLHLLEEDVASAADINAAIRDGYARRTSVIGPLETIDVAGVDLFETVASDLYPHLCSDEEVQDVFGDLLSGGRTGIDAGHGFFEYDEAPEAIRSRRDDHLAALENCFDDFEE